MTTHELLTFQLTDVSKQLNGVLNGFDPVQADRKVTPKAMSARETLAHLCECYHAFLEDAEGRKHDWGTFTAKSTEWEHLLEEMNEIRTRAVGVALSRDDENNQIKATEFILLHDAYHVGQLVTLRIETDPEWNPYAIYG